MDKKVENGPENKCGRVESADAGWRVLMVKHPKTGLYYAAGIKLGQ